MVGALLAGLDLPELHPGVTGGAVEHFDEQLLGGEVAARAGGQISAPGQQLHGPVVDLLIAAHGVVYRLAALGEGRGIEDDEIVLPGLLLQLRKQVEHVGGALCEVKIGERTDMRATGSEQSLTFVKTDGTTCVIRFEQRNLLYEGDAYQLENDAALWKALREAK